MNISRFKPVVEQRLIVDNSRIEGTIIGIVIPALPEVHSFIEHRHGLR